MDLSNRTTLIVYFKDLTCIRYRRDVYMTWDGLFASFGGIFGLCLGGSVLSLVEMAYFFTIRLSLTIYRKMTGKDENGNDQKKDAQQQLQQQRRAKELAASRRIYSLTPILNMQYRGLARKRTQKGVW